MAKALHDIILANAIQLISDKKRWTRFEKARDHEGLSNSVELLTRIGVEELTTL